MQTRYYITAEDLDDIVASAQALGRDKLFFQIAQHEDDGTGVTERKAKQNVEYSAAELDALIDTLPVIKEEDD